MSKNEKLDSSDNLHPLMSQFGDLNISRNHLSGYTPTPATLDGFIKHVNMAGVTADGSRKSGSDAVTCGNAIFFDHDGKEKSLNAVVDNLEKLKISYIAYPSPSFKNKKKEGLYRYRLVIAVTDGLAPDNYRLNALKLAEELDMKWGSEIWDTALLAVKQPIYPPLMKGVTEPKGVKPKPRNMLVADVMDNLMYSTYEPWETQTDFTEDEAEALEETLPQKVDENGDVIARNDIKTVHIKSDTQMYLNGEAIGTMEECAGKALFDDEVRCDCPWDASVHSKEPHDYAYFDDKGMVHCRNAHANLRGSKDEAEVSTQKKHVGNVSLYAHGNSYTIIQKNIDGTPVLYENLNRTTLRLHHISGRKKVVDQIIFNAVVIGGIDYKIDLLQEEKATYATITKEDGKQYLVMTTNPIKYWTFDEDFKLNQPLLDEYFNVILDGKVKDIIDIVAQTIKNKQTKKNNLLLVAPSDVGKTELFEQMSFLTLTGLEWMKSLASKDMIAENTSSALMRSGLALIDDIPYIDAVNTKTSMGTTKLRVIQQGIVDHPTLFKAYTTTDISKAATLADELWNRFMVVRVENNGLTVPESEFYMDDPEEYRNQTQHVLRKMIVEAFKEDTNMEKLEALRETYSAEQHSEMPEMFKAVRSAVLKSSEVLEFTNPNGKRSGVIGRNIKKSVIRQELLAQLDGDYVKDITKHINDIFEDMFTSKSSGYHDGEKYTAVFYLKDEYQDEVKDVENGFTDLDIDEL